MGMEMNANRKDAIMPIMGLRFVSNRRGFFPGAKEGGDLRYSFLGYYYI
jgi:hypothetical protein